jgi:predicted esterase
MAVFRVVTFVMGLLLAPFAAALLGLAFVVWPSWSGWAYCLGTALLAAGLLASLRARHPGLAAVGAATLLGAAGAHALTAARGTRLSMTTTATGFARWTGRIIDEGDGATLGAYLLVGVGVIPDPDARYIPRAMREAYHEMRSAEGDMPSPVVPTYLGLQSSDRADVVVVEPSRPPRGALIFLHGSGGNYALPCWEIARAAAEADLVTYCPSVGWRGEWANPDGERTLQAALRLARAHGNDRVFLAGLSNGAIGASLLAPRMRGAFRGVILISGASPRAGSSGVPTLVLQGSRDALCPPDIARAYAKRVDATYVALEGGHFALLLHRENALRAIASWLARS